jgi:hypothetical protein
MEDEHVCPVDKPHKPWELGAYWYKEYETEKVNWIEMYD